MKRTKVLKLKTNTLKTEFELLSYLSRLFPVIKAKFHSQSVAQLAYHQSVVSFCLGGSHFSVKQQWDLHSFQLGSH